jgi:hypothetical protein
MIIIRFFTVLSTGLVVTLSLLAIPGIVLLFWQSDQNAGPPALPYEYQCEFGVYDTVKHNWEPLVNGEFPRFGEPYADQYAVTYAVKITVTNDSTSQSLDLAYDGSATLTLLPSGTLWESDNDFIWQSQTIAPGGSGVGYGSMSYGADGDTSAYVNGTLAPPADCQLDATFYSADA